MPLQVIDLDERNLLGQSQPFGKRCAYQQAAQQTRTTRESYRRQIRRLNARTTQCRIDHRHNIQQVRTARQLRHHAAILLVYLLRGNDITKQYTITNDGR